tara:strand:+ start:2595 stop:3293 length:699 start_codon:yes stop_codon:yes gene_type:complete
MSTKINIIPHGAMDECCDTRACRVVFGEKNLLKEMNKALKTEELHCDVCNGTDHVGYIDTKLTAKVCEHCDVDGDNASELACNIRASEETDSESESESDSDDESESEEESDSDVEEDDQEWALLPTHRYDCSNKNKIKVVAGGLMKVNVGGWIRNQPHKFLVEMTNGKIKNPKTGRMVLRTGRIGKKLAELELLLKLEKLEKHWGSHPGYNDVVPIIKTIKDRIIGKKIPVE